MKIIFSEFKCHIVVVGKQCFSCHARTASVVCGTHTRCLQIILSVFCYLLLLSSSLFFLPCIRDLAIPYLLAVALAHTCFLPCVCVCVCVSEL